MHPVPQKRSSLLLAGMFLVLLLAACGQETTPAAPSRSPASELSVATSDPRLSRPLAAAGALARATQTPVPSLTPTAAKRMALTPIPTTPTPTATATVSPTATPSPTFVAHTVQQEETLYGIADRYGVTVDAVVGANDLPNPNFVTVGQVLRIPPAVGNNVPAAEPTRDYGYTIVGFSVEGRAIEAFTFGEGANDVLFVGGIHGGYEWNTTLLAYQIIDYFNGNRAAIPSGVTIHVVPAANPDGLFQTTGRDGRFDGVYIEEGAKSARFNARGVDLNRNWSCNWSSSARWGSTSVDPGSGPFSEPETRALSEYILKLSPRAVIFWHSAFKLVAPGHCGGGAGSDGLAQIYAAASGYPMGPFSAYDLSGTASDWVSEQGIPAAAVELTYHESTDFGQNLAGVLAVLDILAAPNNRAGGDLE